MNQQLLIEELTPVESNLITESSDDKNVWLSGIFMQANVRNRNGRNYPISEISEAVRAASTLIEANNGIFGELDHPQTLTINLDRISHVITSLQMEGDNAVGRARLLDTPMGKIGKELVKSGVQLGVSSRGAGAVNESGGVSNFSFVTVDIVANPSAPGAVPNTIYESLEEAKNGKHIMDLAEAVRHDEAAQKYFQKEILKFLSTGLFAKK